MKPKSKAGRKTFRVPKLMDHKQVSNRTEAILNTYYESAPMKIEEQQPEQKLLVKKEERKQLPKLEKSDSVKPIRTFKPRRITVKKRTKCPSPHEYSEDYPMQPVLRVR